MATPRLGQVWKPTVHATEVPPSIGTNPDKYENRPHEEPRAGWRKPIFRSSIAGRRNSAKFRGVRLGSWSCKNAAVRVLVSSAAGVGTSLECSCPDGGDQRLNADDVHDAGQIVGQHVQCHLG